MAARLSVILAQAEKDIPANLAASSKACFSAAVTRTCKAVVFMLKNVVQMY